MEEVKKIKEFLKLENKLVLKLRIKPLSPFCIKLSCDDDENDSNSLSAFQTTESGKKIINNSQTKGEKKATEIYKRNGEIYIPGSTLKEIETDYIKKLFGNVENKKDGNEIAKKSRFFIQDSFLVGETERVCKGSNKIKKVLLRELFYNNEKEQVFNPEYKEKIIKIRAITPIDHFSSKAKVPLQYEYTMETFSTELIINNAKLQDLQGIYFIIRDSWNQEIRIGNSKTRGFGLIKFEIEDLIYEQFKSKDDDLKVLENFFEEQDNKREEKLIKFHFSKKLYLKEDFKKLYEKDGNPTDFIISLFKAEGGKK